MAAGQSNVDSDVLWSFGAEDKVWNSVLACDGCNPVSEKGCNPPNDRFIQMLIHRNQLLLGIEVSVLPKCINTELSEWKNGGPKEHIELFVNNFWADGFGIWFWD